MLRTRNRTFHRNHIGLSRENGGSVLQNIQSLRFRQSTFTKEMSLEKFMIWFLFPVLIICEELVVRWFMCNRFDNLKE